MANAAAAAAPAGYIVYSYLDTSPVTADMTTNLQAVLDVAAVPEPTAGVAAVAAALAVCLAHRRWKHRHPRTGP
jgi:hypothetical protein